MSAITSRSDKTVAASAATGRRGRLRPSYWPFVIPALVVAVAVIVFPWAFTLWMSVNAWQLGGSVSFVGWENYARLAGDARFWESMGHTLFYTLLSVVAPLILGTLAAVLFDSRMPLRGFLRAIFVMPMMATPVAIALVWTMMFNPSLGDPPPLKWSALKYGFGA